MKWFSFLSNHGRILNKAVKLAQRVDLYKEVIRKLTDPQLRNKTDEFINRLASGETLDDLLPEAFATVREGIFREYNIFAYHVQLVGATVIHFGDFAEMQTGEGKTITIVIACYLNALLKKGIHVVTVNEYLVKRDSDISRRVLNRLGISVGFVTSELNKELKQRMYACDVTYVTNSELGFDYLRDNMVGHYHDKVIGALNYAIIDEADSVLIDEARTPLIISGSPRHEHEAFVRVDRFVRKLEPADYEIFNESRSIVLTKEGVIKTEKHFKLKNLYAIDNSLLLHKIANALTANFVFQNGKEYIVQEDKIMLVDQFTGRILAGRSYNSGLQQAIQAKENVEIEPENITVATLTYQSFFQLYKKISGLSGTAFTESEEIMEIYNMVVVPIPTNKPIIRKDHNDYVFLNKESKWKAVAHEIKIHHENHQPILVGTSSVDDSEILHQLLLEMNIKHEVLNAKNNARESQIISKAGQKDAVTIATNMAGRGTDIKLGKEVFDLGLYVIGTERSESRRVDNQLRGRSGRQGNPGKTRFFISLEDSLFKRFASDKFEKAKTKMNSDYFDSKFFTLLLNNTQKRVEGINFDVRKNLIDYDQVLASQRELVYKQRDKILLSEENYKVLIQMLETVVGDLINFFTDKKNTGTLNYQGLVESINFKVFAYPILVNEDLKKKTVEESREIITNLLQISVQERVKVLTPKIANLIITDILLSNLDHNWQTHLDNMVKLRENVSLLSLEQKSPLNIYVEKGDLAFKLMKSNVAHESIIAFNQQKIPKINEKIYNTFHKIEKDEIPSFLYTANLSKTMIEKDEDFSELYRLTNE